MQHNATYCATHCTECACGADTVRTSRASQDSLSSASCSVVAHIEENLEVGGGSTRTQPTPGTCKHLVCRIVCCGVLRCVAVCCSVIQCVAVCCSVL